MRTNLIICIVITLALILCPIAAVGSESDVTDEKIETKASETQNEESYISVMSSSTGEIDKIGMREYIIGCVSAEMSASSHTEALKAQAVASYTYAKKTREQNSKHKDSELGNADITDSSDKHQGYLNEKQRKEKWGEKYDEYEKKIETAVDAVFGSYLSFNGETVLSVYHAISAGSTQSAKSLWGTEIPYLASVESPGDKLSPDYIKTVSFSETEFKKAMKKCDVKLTGDAENWINGVKESDEGYVLSLTLNKQNISASIIRECLGLRSLCFNVKYTDGEFVFTSYGYGHGVGMSQYGADYMARQGSSWREILLHYYQGASIEEDI